MMKFILKPSLEHMALVKIGSLLWNQNDVRALISKLRSRDLYPNEWEEIEKGVIEKVRQLLLPRLLKEKVIGVISPIGKEILEWMWYYRSYDVSYDVYMEFNCLGLDLPAHLPAEFCWTPQGTVDRKRTAEVLLRDENLEVSRRYRLACDYCLEDDIFRFWNRLPGDVKDYHWKLFPVVSFWSDNMKRGGAGHKSYNDIFYSSVRDSNKVAARYFLQKLTKQEREESLKELADHIEDADVLCFLLSEMEEEEQKEVFKNNPVDVLQCFLQRPWQSFYIGVANCMWEFLSKDNYQKILGNIIYKVKDGCKDYNYQKLFKEFWQKSPNVLKDSFIGEIDTSWLMQCLFVVKDKENIRLILKDATLTAKAKLIYNEEIYYYLMCSIRENDFDFLEFFIRECLPSRTEMLKFKKEFEKHVYFKEYCVTKKQEWDQLFHFSDDSVCESVKRTVEEGESSSSKRFQSTVTHV